MGGVSVSNRGDGLRFEEVLDVRLTVVRKGESSVTYGFEFTREDTLVARGFWIADANNASLPQTDAGIVEMWDSQGGGWLQKMNLLDFALFSFDLVEQAQGLFTSRVHSLLGPETGEIALML